MRRRHKPQSVPCLQRRAYGCVRLFCDLMSQIYCTIQSQKNKKLSLNLAVLRYKKAYPISLFKGFSTKQNPLREPLLSFPLPQLFLSYSPFVVGSDSCFVVTVEYTHLRLVYYLKKKANHHHQRSADFHDFTNHRRQL